MWSSSGVHSFSICLWVSSWSVHVCVFNQQLKKELDAFDPAFFEEIEDLKYNYQEAVKKNIQYEEQLTALAKQFGVSVPGLEISWVLFSLNDV